MKKFPFFTFTEGNLVVAIWFPILSVTITSTGYTCWFGSILAGYLKKNTFPSGVTENLFPNLSISLNFSPVLV